MASTDDYVNLIAGQHTDKPKFIASIQALVAGLVDLQNLEQTIPSTYNLDTAVGVQLDAIGLWIGISRYLLTPLTGVYFEWSGDPLVGWDSGSWKGVYDPLDGLTVLPDDSYRTLLKAKAVANAWDGTIPSASAIWSAVFGSDQTVIIQDNQDMTMILGLVGAPLSAIDQALLTGGYIPLKPLGVRITSYALPVDTGPLFAWGVSSPFLEGWGSGSWARFVPPT